MTNKPLRVDLKYYHEIEDIIRQRIITGRDKVFDKKSPSRITAGIPRHPLWPVMKKDLIKADMPNLEDK